MSRFKSLYFVIFIINLCIISAQISDKRLCVDEECKVPISLARTLLRYSSPDSRILSFAPNVDVTIYSKSAGSREDLWGGEINGKRGYVPKHLVRETKVFQKPTLLVDTEFSNDTGAQQVPSQVEPAKVQEPYEVVDGTTIYLSPQEDISPSSTENPIEPTALPLTEATSDDSKVASNEQNYVKTETTDTINIENKEENSSHSEPSSEANLKTTNPFQEALTSEGSEKQLNTEEQNEKVKSEEIKTPDEKSTIQNTSKDEEEVSQEDAVEVEEDEEDDENDDEDEESEESEAVIEKKGDQEMETKNEPLINAKEEYVAESTTRVSDENKSEEIKEQADLNVTEESATNEVNAELLSETSPKEEINLNSINESLVNEETNKELPSPPEGTQSPYIDSAEILTLDSSTIQQEASKSEDTEKVNNQEINVKTEESKEQINTETTTVTPELEVPQPFIDSSADVTPNPLEVATEEVKTIENTVPTLSLFGFPDNQILNTSTSEDVESTENQRTENKENGDNNQILDEKEANDFAFTEESKNIVTEEKEANDFAFTEESKNIVTEEKEVPLEIEQEQGSGLLSGIFSMFSSSDNEKTMESNELTSTHVENSEKEHADGDELISITGQDQSCDATSCTEEEKKVDNQAETTHNMDYSFLFNFNSDFLLYLVTTAVSVIIFLFGYIAFDKNQREGPLVARINTLEKELLILVKENQILQEKVITDSGCERISNEVVENLKQELFEITAKKNALEEQVQLLEKELENSTEVGMELNKMLSDILSSESGSDVLKANVEHLQRQLVEQQATINSINETLTVTNTENHELRLELELSNKKVLDLQTELDKLLLNVLKIEEEKETQQTSLENEITTYRQKYEEISVKLRMKEEEYNIEIKQLKNRLDQTERNLELKLKEHDILTDTIKQLKAMKSNDGPSLQALLDSSSLKAEVQQLKAENEKFRERLQNEEEAKSSYEKRAEAAIAEAKILREKYDEVDKLRVESETKLEVLSNYFKDREAQLQKEISKHESLWEEKQGEASSTTERIKFMQEQLQNYKAQTESLKQEIMSQEVELKSQISVLEKKAHENWVSARQAERKLEEAKQEAAQLRHRLTLRERAIQEDKTQHRFQSPVEQNGDMLVASPIESPASPPLLYGARDHITKSPPIPGLPPFLPPPPGVPFMPPPLPGVPPFIPPPPTMFPGDRRPPPLGRMSSPPLNSRYSPSSRGYSPYDRNSSSPSDSEYGTSPPQRRGYSPFNSRGEDRRDYKRPSPGRSNGRSMMKGGGSSGSGHSNESLDKVSRQQSKV